MATVFGKQGFGKGVARPSTARRLESFGHDGLEIARLRRHRRSLPVRQILLFLLAVISFKVFLFLNLGGAAYGAKVTELSEGILIERVAGYGMALDPVSKYLVNGFYYGSW
jgi:hypothetical protein